MPRISRPPDSTSRLAISFASTTGLRCAINTMPVPSLIRSVTAAMYDSTVDGCSIGNSGGAGDGDFCGSGNTTCSPVHTDSRPACSAACATCRATAGSAQIPEPIPNMPIFMMTSAFALSGFELHLRSR